MIRKRWLSVAWTLTCLDVKADDLAVVGEDAFNVALERSRKAELRISSDEQIQLTGLTVLMERGILPMKRAIVEKREIIEFSCLFGRGKRRKDNFVFFTLFALPL